MLYKFRLGDRVKLNNFGIERLYGGYYPHLAEKARMKVFTVIGTSTRCYHPIAAVRADGCSLKTRSSYDEDFLELIK